MQAMISSTAQLSSALPIEFCFLQVPVSQP
jgi:hypothetical protein